MAKQNENETPATSGAPAASVTTASLAATPALSTADLLGLLTAAISQSQEGTQAQLLAVLSEMRNPQKSDGEKALDEQMRKQNRIARERKEANIKADQENCPHLQGSHPLSQKTGEGTSIVKHRLDDNRVVGICTNCLRVFEPTDKDYMQQMRRKSGNQMSQAGQRFAVQMG